MKEIHFEQVFLDDVQLQQGQITVAADVNLHYVRAGQGPAVLLLHGWPGFWYDWRRVIPQLTQTADVIAPDFRGYGFSSKPDLPPAEAYTPEILAQDVISLLDQLGVKAVTVAAHDIGATVAQHLAKNYPERVRALVLLNPPYPGIGERRFLPAAQQEFWYQHLHNLPLAEKLIGHSRETVRVYLEHFYTHWMGRNTGLLADEFEKIVDVYAQPGAIRGSLAYYKARAKAKSAATASPQSKQAAANKIDSSKIQQPTTVLWGDADPVIPYVWSDRLGEYFANYSLQILPGVGHFTAFEAGAEVAEAIQAIMA